MEPPCQSRMNTIALMNGGSDYINENYSFTRTNST